MFIEVNVRAMGSPKALVAANHIVWIQTVEGTGNLSFSRLHLTGGTNAEPMTLDVTDTAQTIKARCVQLKSQNLA